MSDDDDFDDIFDEMERNIKRFFRGNPFAMFDDLFEDLEDVATGEQEPSPSLPPDLIREIQEPDGSVKREIGPIVYGYTATIGPNGKPVIARFGNLAPNTGRLSDSREPPIEIQDEGKTIRITADMPGVNAEDITATVENNPDPSSYAVLEIVAQNPETQRRYSKMIALPAPVKSDVVKSFNNGILEIRLTKV